MQVEWSVLKNMLDGRGVSAQYVTLDSNYWIKAIDGHFQLECMLPIDPSNSDTVDFETNYKPNGNKKLEQLDSDSAPMARIKQAPTGWNYQNRGFEFTTATFTLINKDTSGADLTDVTVKLYDASNTLLSSGQESIAVKTVIDFEPTYDYYIISGQARCKLIPTTDVRLSVVGVPDIPAEYGGSKAFIQNINLKFLSTGDKIEADGRAAKFLVYSATYHTNKLRVVIFHPTGEQHDLLINVELYRA